MLNENQYGFREGSSTVYLLLEASEVIYKCTRVNLGLGTTFDVVQHNVLLSKREVGIKRVGLNLITFLVIRFQRRFFYCLSFIRSLKSHL